MSVLMGSKFAKIRFRRFSLLVARLGAAGQLSAASRAVDARGLDVTERVGRDPDILPAPLLGRSGYQSMLAALPAAPRRHQATGGGPLGRGRRENGIVGYANFIVMRNILLQIVIRDGRC
jgi:hypothetical protein